jgi:hypothetical protein
MSGALPEGLQALLSQAPPGGAGPALPQGLQGDNDDQGYSALDCLKDVIDDFPKLLTELSDPKDVETAVSALKLLASIQTRLMQGGSGAPQPGQ